MKKIILIIIFTAFLPLVLYAEWTEEEIGNLTKEIQIYVNDWGSNQTIGMLKEAEGSNNYVTVIGTDRGGALHINILGGQTVLLNGKDITGNLGSKTTYGNYSPILEDIKNSTIDIGPSATTEKKINLNFSFPIALSISIISIGLYIFQLKRKKRRAKK